MDTDGGSVSVTATGSGAAFVSADVPFVEAAGEGGSAALSSPGEIDGEGVATEDVSILCEGENSIVAVVNCGEGDEVGNGVAGALVVTIFAVVVSIPLVVSSFAALSPPAHPDTNSVRTPIIIQADTHLPFFISPPYRSL